MSSAPRHERDHYTRCPAHWVAGTSDVGHKHRINQDALCIAVKEHSEKVAVVAISDGVSTAAGSERASLVAAETAVNRIMQGIENNEPAGDMFVAAFHDAHDAVMGSPVDGEPSACTLIAALITPGLVIVGNVGDTRAYWFGDDGSNAMLSTDDSMAQTRIMLGMSREEAENSSQAHSIVKWLGRMATDVTPTMTTHQPTSHGWVLLCSDGLWNYASSVEDMAAIVSATLEANPVPELATQALTHWANEQGGRDNITVALVRYES